MSTTEKQKIDLDKKYYYTSYVSSLCTYREGHLVCVIVKNEGHRKMEEKMAFSAICPVWFDYRCDIEGNEVESMSASHVKYTLVLSDSSIKSAYAYDSQETTKGLTFNEFLKEYQKIKRVAFEYEEAFVEYISERKGC